MWESPEGVPYPPGSRDRGTGIWSPRRNYVKSVTRATSSLRDDAAHLARESKCFACNAFVPPRDVGVADHLVPLSRGGSAGPENRLVLCRDCNYRSKGRKGATDFIEWWYGRGFALDAFVPSWVGHRPNASARHLGLRIIRVYTHCKWHALEALGELREGCPPATWRLASDLAIRLLPSPKHFDEAVDFCRLIDVPPVAITARGPSRELVEEAVA